MFRFYDYTDGQGANPFWEWPAAQSPRARAKIQTRIADLEKLPRNQWGNLVGPLVGLEWDKIFEMRFFVDQTQMRPLFCFGAGRNEATILMGAVERDDEIEPKSAARTCRIRKREIEGGGHAVRHRFN